MNTYMSLCMSGYVCICMTSMVIIKCQVGELQQHGELFYKTL